MSGDEDICIESLLKINNKMKIALEWYRDEVAYLNAVKTIVRVGNTRLCVDRLSKDAGKRAIEALNESL